MKTKTLLEAFQRIVDGAQEEEMSLWDMRDNERDDSAGYGASAKSLQKALEKSGAIRKAIAAHDALLAIAKKYHGYDDPLHNRAMPECSECQAIAKAEARAIEKAEGK